ncbi:aminotransferase DegT [Thermococci archaeon]|nr:MAG: aminotransferase DegT [Thermococci archaeon]
MIPIAKPLMGKKEIENVTEVLKSGMLASGEWVKKFEKEFANYIGVKHAIAMASGTVALDNALKVLGIREGDEVIVPDFTFIATANAVLFQNAKPVFADVSEKTFNINPDDIVKKITPKTKAVIGVHLFGHPFNVKALQEICEDHNLFLIEDSAQAHGAEFDDTKVGNFGTVSCFSFYATKNMTTGEGGMITTNDKKIERKLRLIINHGQSEKYLHTELGYNYRMTNIQAAIGIAQLKKLDMFNDKRIKNAGYFNKHIKAKKIIKPEKEKNIKHVYHQYVIRVENNKRDELIRYLNDKGVGNAIHYPLPVHLQPLYRKLNYPKEICPTATKISKEVLSLPVHPALKREELEYVCETINNWRY